MNRLSSISTDLFDYYKGIKASLLKPGSPAALGKKNN